MRARAARGTAAPQLLCVQAVVVVAPISEMPIAAAGVVAMVVPAPRAHTQLCGAPAGATFAFATPTAVAAPAGVAAPIVVAADIIEQRRCARTLANR